MILVDNQPILSLPESDLRRKWYEKEIAIIKKKPDLFIKRTTYYKLSDGKRKKPPRHAVNSHKLISTDRGMENWACCDTYTKDDKTGRLSLKPNCYHFQDRHRVDPRKDFEKVFFFTCVLNLQNLGFIVEDQEREAKERSDKELAEMDVRYAIFRQLDDTRLKDIARAWGIAGVDSTGINVLREALFTTVKRSHEAYIETKKGFKEFMDDVLYANPEVIEARKYVSLALERQILDVNATSRHVKYNGNTLFILPLEQTTRKTDYIADKFLEGQGRMEGMMETLRQDIDGPKPDFVISIAEVDQLRTREELDSVAEKLKVPITKNLKDETVRNKIIEKIQST
jgi:hypothetical protein